MHRMINDIKKVEFLSLVAQHTMRITPSRLSLDPIRRAHWLRYLFSRANGCRPRPNPHPVNLTLYGRCNQSPHGGGRRMTQPPHVDDEIRPKHPPVVPIPLDPFIPKGRLQRLVNLFPAGQFLRYLGVGIFNTVFGYISFVVVLTLLNAVLPAHLLYLTVILASILSTPLNITVAYFCYK